MRTTQAVTLSDGLSCSTTPQNPPIMSHPKIIRPILLICACWSLNFSLLAQTNAIDDPIKNFEALWQSFNERYANFELKKVDWQEVYQRYRPMVTAQTDNKALFDICCKMVQELNDGHVTMDAVVGEEEWECGPPYNFFYDRAFTSDSEFETWVDVVKTTLEGQGFMPLIALPYTKETKLRYSLSDDYGYLRISGMAEGPTWGKLKKSMHEVMEAVQDKKGLIIDLRLNGGGWDWTSFKIAGRFVAQKTIGLYKHTRKKGTDQFHRQKTWYVKPKGPIQFVKPIVILTSDYTASAAEVFLLVMQQFSYVTIIGDESEGIFSDMLMRKLPNKWHYSLSHQQYFSVDRQNYEGLGIPVVHKVLNTKSDLTTGIDPVLVKAVEVLNQQTATSN